MEWESYDMAKLFRAKFTTVWYQLRRGHEGLGLHGRHDVNQRWIKDARREGSPLNLYAIFLCMIIGTCVTSRAIVTGTRVVSLCMSPKDDSFMSGSLDNTVRL